ncbi:phenoloxidase 1-like [Contarinia nasturtii]|uniref:phenoloxidase 1-like n=1 Tax=Contarinia nasturtii TaxID=265458 RepID=UPI0012D3F439|nr:phenoloxidase 1-like [Contarinia nasturtii]
MSWITVRKSSSYGCKTFYISFNLIFLLLDVDLGAGLDFGPGNVYAQFTHLQHAPFEYRINVRNETPSMKQGTCRIFLVPKYDERGEPLRFREQRLFAIEMDKFLVNLNPGENEIRRRSEDSSVTIPYERSFRRIGSLYQPERAEDLAQFQFCGCGWPQHLLLPKGSASGTRFDIFVMISDYEYDRVDQTLSSNVSCNDALSFCGMRDQKYPDLQRMGYPFDKSTSLANNQEVPTLREFTEQLSNASLGECLIKFTNTIIDRKN